MSRILYDIFLRLFLLGARIKSLWDPKARLWLSGRRHIYERIGSASGESGGKCIWMHCASLGEFEQGRPLLEELQHVYPDCRTVLSFFSPSGFEAMKEYKGAGTVTYLPMDSSTNAKTFINSINPSLVIWVKYEFWYYYLHELKERNIPVVLVSGIFRAGQPFFRGYGGIWRKMLGCFSHYFVQDENSVKLLAGISVNKGVTLNGDTRFDRVLDIARHFEQVPFISDFCGESRVIVAGSTWEEDEIELLHYVKTHPEIKFIIAPHEIDRTNLDKVKGEFINSVFYSELTNDLPIQQNGVHVLIIDNIGMLSRIYRYATITYIGGGFGTAGVHNVLEAAVYGKPVIFGPEYDKYIEAAGLVKAGGAISFNHPLGLEEILENLFEDENELIKMGEASRNFVASRQGATRKIIDYIQVNRLLTN